MASVARAGVALAALVVQPLLTACGPTGANAPAAADQTSSPAAAVPVERDEQGRPKRYSLTPYGYNYTDLYIDSFEVDGAGGGNLEVSTPTAGGGKHACCVPVFSGLPLGTTFRVKWTRNRSRWCEQDVPLKNPIPTEPRYLEVHFYPDGRIEIEATQKASRPRIAMERFGRGERHPTNNVNNDEKLSRCKDGYR